MAHFAEIDENDIVLRVIVAEQDFIDSGSLGDPSKWIQTSYNTFAGQHQLGGVALRKNFASAGCVYDRTKDAFIPPRPQAEGNYVLNEETCIWDKIV